MQFITKNEKDTANLGNSFGEKCKGGEIFLLSGDLGAGKTQFTKGLANGLEISDDITSPTFTYEKIYSGRDNLTLYHFDLYREILLDQDIKLLLDEAFSDPKGVTAVEWSERGEGNWPKRAKRVELKWISEKEREITVE